MIGFGITEKTIGKLGKADGLVVGSAICREITRSIKRRQKSCHKCRQYGKKIKIENNMNWIKNT